MMAPCAAVRWTVARAAAGCEVSMLEQGPQVPEYRAATIQVMLAPALAAEFCNWPVAMRASCWLWMAALAHHAADLFMQGQLQPYVALQEDRDNLPTFSVDVFNGNSIRIVIYEFELDDNDPPPLGGNRAPPPAICGLFVGLRGAGKSGRWWIFGEPCPHSRRAIARPIAGPRSFRRAFTNAELSTWKPAASKPIHS